MVTYVTMNREYTTEELHGKKVIRGQFGFAKGKRYAIIGFSSPDQPIANVVGECAVVYRGRSISYSELGRYLDKEARKGSQIVGLLVNPDSGELIMSNNIATIITSKIREVRE